MLDNKYLQVENIFSDFNKVHEASRNNYRDWLNLHEAGISCLDEKITTKVTLSNGFVVEISFRHIKE